MKIIARKESLVQDGAEKLLILRVSNLHHQAMLEELEDNPLAVELTPLKSKRSIEQNKYLWLLLAEIDKAINGERSNSEWEIYCEALERAGAKYEMLMAPEAAEKMLKQAFRAVQYVQSANDACAWYKCYYGSSKMTTKEMAELIETVLDMAAEADIEIDYWKEVLR